MDNSLTLIREKASAILDEITAIRRELHMSPELSCEEIQTAALICRKLEEFGIPFKRGVAGTGVVGWIEGQDPASGCVALRADMDALPVNELTNVPFRSKTEGKMHACGHDVHMACLLGAAKILAGMKNRFRGTVKLLFQPSEETYPGGAIGMIREGVLKDPDVKCVIGQHVINTLDSGTVGMRPGRYMASTDEVFLTVHGKGGHAATPDQVIDPILIASHIVVALQQIVSRKASPLVPTVLSFGKISGEGRTNIIPDTVTLEGTIRTYDESWRKTIHTTIAGMSSAIAESMGGSCDTRISHGYPFLHNDEALTAKIREASIEYLGENNVSELEPRMTAEDFSYFAGEVPSCLYRLGIRNEKKGIVANLHSPVFDVDESSLENGMGLMAFLAVRMLVSE